MVHGARTHRYTKLHAYTVFLFYVVPRRMYRSRGMLYAKQRSCIIFFHVEFSSILHSTLSHLPSPISLTHPFFVTTEVIFSTIKQYIIMYFNAFCSTARGLLFSFLFFTTFLFASPGALRRIST